MSAANDRLRVPLAVVLCMTQRCPPPLCDAIEATANCTFGFRSGFVWNPCTPDVIANLTNRSLLDPLRRCTICGVDRKLHSVVRAAHGVPSFPPRESATFCASDDTSASREALLGTLQADYAQRAHASLVLSSSLCFAHGNDEQAIAEQREWPTGLISRLHGMHTVDGHNRRMNVQLSGKRTLSGAQHVILEGRVEPGAAARPGLDQQEEGPAVVARVYLPRGWRYNASKNIDQWLLWPRPLKCRFRAEGRGQHASVLHCPTDAERSASHSADGAEDTRAAAAFFEHCTRRAATDQHRGSSKDVALASRLIGEMRGWPTLLAAGCCAYRVSAEEVIALPVEIRESYLPPGNSTKGVRLEDRPAKCQDEGTSEADCALDRTLASLQVLESLTETSHHLIFGEHLQAHRHQDTATPGGQPCTRA